MNAYLVLSFFKKEMSNIWHICSPLLHFLVVLAHLFTDRINSMNPKYFQNAEVTGAFRFSRELWLYSFSKPNVTNLDFSRNFNDRLWNYKLTYFSSVACRFTQHWQLTGTDFKANSTCIQALHIHWACHTLGSWTPARTLFIDLVHRCHTRPSFTPPRFSLTCSARRIREETSLIYEIKSLACKSLINKHSLKGDGVDL